jgi:precorrin-2/cobalt-factor-2 C20-methyltransferase
MNNFAPLTAVGVGPGDPELLTLKAVRALSEAATIFTARSTKNGHSLALDIARPHIKSDAPVVELAFPMTRKPAVLAAAWQANAEAVLEVSRRGEPSVFLTLGDPSTYSTFGYLRRTLKALEPDFPVRVVPGVTSYAAAAALCNQVLVEGAENLAIVSGIDDPEGMKAALRSCPAAVIMKAYRSYPAIRQVLMDLDLMDRAMFVSCCGLDGEALCRELPPPDAELPYFSLILVRGKGEE